MCRRDHQDVTYKQCYSSLYLMITVAQLFKLYDGPSSVNLAGSLKDMAVPVNPGVADSPLVFPSDLFKAVKKGREVGIHYGPSHNDIVATLPANNGALITVMGRVDARGTDITLSGPNPPSESVCLTRLNSIDTLLILFSLSRLYPGGLTVRGPSPLSVPSSLVMRASNRSQVILVLVSASCSKRRFHVVNLKRCVCGLTFTH
jgi:hypothetical protein